MKRPRVLHVTTVPLSLRFLRGQASYMKMRGLEIGALTSPGEELETFAQQEQIRVFGVRMWRQIAPLHDVVSTWRICRQIRGWRPLIVHAQTPKAGLLGMIAAWLTDVPVRIYHIRGLPFVTATGWRRLLLQWTERISCILAHRVLCVSYSVCDVAIKNGICAQAKTKVLASGSGNGVDAEQQFNPATISATARMEVRMKFGISDNSTVIGFVGRVVRDKGIVELADAWRELRQEDGNLHLLVVGPIETRDAVPQRVMDALQSDPRVHMIGKQFELVSLYAAMDVVVLPTYREGFPNVPLEAAAMELPVIATNVPGCVDAVLDGVTGFLIEPRSARALSDKLRLYLNDPPLRRLHGEAGRVRVLRSFRPEVIWQALFNEYISLAEERGVVLPDAYSCTHG